MANSPAGKFGTTVGNGTPHGSPDKTISSEVPATASDSDTFTIFPGAKAGRHYYVLADCATDDCWRASGSGPFYGPDGDGVTVVSSGAFAGMYEATFAVKMPGTTFTNVGSRPVIFRANADGDILGAFAEASGAHSDNEGSMPVVVKEIAERSPSGEVDDLGTFLISGSGGAFPETGTIGTADFYIDADIDGIVNSVDYLLIEGLTHTFVGEIEISLRSPFGNIVPLVTRLGAGTVRADSDFNGDYVFDDTVTEPYDFEGGELVPGSYRPDGSLSGTLAGEQATGRWTLHFNDLHATRSGSFTSWSMQLKVGARDREEFVESDPAPQLSYAALSNFSDFIFITGGGGGSWPTVAPTSFDVLSLVAPVSGTVNKIVNVRLDSFEHGYPGDLHLVLFAPDGNGVTIFHRPGSTSGSPGNALSFEAGQYIFENTGTLLPDAAIIFPGTYGRDPGDWPGGPIPLGDFNSLEGVRTDGVWNLVLYKWDVHSSGTLSGAVVTIEYIPD